MIISWWVGHLVSIVKENEHFSSHSPCILYFIGVASISTLSHHQIEHRIFLIIIIVTIFMNQEFIK